MTDQIPESLVTGTAWLELTTKLQAADNLQISQDTINNYFLQELRRANKLPGGRLVRIRREDLLRLLKERQR
jgi:hypothetical protein